MDSTQRSVFQPRTVLHPGETVMEYLEHYGWSQSDLARRAGLTPKTVSEICSGKTSISPTTALAFENVFQRPAHFWLNLQRGYDESSARSKYSHLLSQWENWASKFPIKEMRDRQFSLPSGRSNVDALLAFFGVSSPESWSSVWQSSQVAYRQTRRSKTREESVAAWVREVEILADQFDLPAFDEKRLKSSIEELRKLTRVRAETILEPLQEICSSAGVAVVLVPELPNTSISGCARWMSTKTALIGLTLRYKTDDQLWFTFFHELGHVVLHRKKQSFVVDNAAEDLNDRIIDPEMLILENEANQFAADTLIPPQELAAFLRKNVFTNESIHDFAKDIGVGPGIVVGRLQHDHVLEQHQGNALKQKINMAFRKES